MRRRFAAAAVAIFALSCFIIPSRAVQADAVADFYRGKQINMVIAFGAGGMYGVNGQIMARHLGRFIPGNPTVVVQHMPGAGGSKAAAYAYNAAPRDGATILELSKDIAVAQKLRPEASKYDARQFHYLGRMLPYAAVLMVWHTAGVKTLADARSKEIIMASSGKSSHAYMEAKLLEKVAGFDFKIVTGYRGAADMYKAMEAGEAHARIGAWVSLKAVKGDWLRDKKVYSIVQTGLKRAPDLPDVPLIVDLAKTEEDRRMSEFMSLGGPVGWGLQTPPGVPEERVAALRKAFDAMVKDPDFVKEANEKGAGVNAATGAEVRGYVDKTLDMPDELIRKMQELAGFKGS